MGAGAKKPHPKDGCGFFETRSVLLRSGEGRASEYYSAFFLDL
jgi:hypothetical protein